MSKNKKILIFLIGISLPLYVLWNIISVDFSYSSITEPKSGVKVNFKKIAGKDLMVFPEEENYLFDRIDLEIKFKEKLKTNQEIEIIAYKNFLATFYPLKERILTENDLKNLLFADNEKDLPIGSLFYNGDSVGILLPNNSYQSFFSAELFKKMNYNWEDVIGKEVGFASDLEEKEIFNYSNSHPSGTVFETPTGFYLVWEEQLFPLEQGIELKNLIKIKPIKLNLLKAESFGSCSGLADDDSFECEFKKDFSMEKSDYIFEIKGFNNEDTKKVELNFSASPSKWSLKNNFLVSVDNAKLKLIKKYRGYIPFI